MFRWLKSSFGKKPESSEAFAKGRDFGELFFAEIERLTVAKFNYVEQKYCELFSGTLTNMVGSELPMPPIHYARALYSHYIDEVKKAESGLREELVRDLTEYESFFREMNMLDTFYKAIDERIGAFGETLRHRGLNVLTQSTDFLKDLDNKWRYQNPENAKLFPND